MPTLCVCKLCLFKLYAEGCNLLDPIYNISSTLMCESFKFSYLLCSLLPPSPLEGGLNDY